MSAEAVDPRTFKSWEDAFQYPVPVVRKLEQQLHGNANDNRERLRSLVGSSYRHLLGTAERIISMDKNMQQVEQSLVGMGRKCNTKAVETVGENFVEFEQNRRDQFIEQSALVAQIAVLHSCPQIISRLIRKRDSYLQAAKLLVISRLLQKSISSSADAPPFVEKLRDHLGALWRRLLQHIDRRFSILGVDVDDLVDEMCAFALATNSTPTDVLRHFHSVRRKSIVRHIAGSGQLDRQAHIVRAIRLYLKTLLDTQSIFPKRLSNALSRLRSLPLLQDKEIRSLTGLGLEIHESYIPESVKNFTPRPRHDELNKSDAEKFLKSWARAVLDDVISNLNTLISEDDDLSRIVDIRKHMLETWLSSHGRTPGIDAALVLDKLRAAMTNQISRVMKQRALALSKVPDSVQKIIEENQAKAPKHLHSLWEVPLTAASLSNGAAEFRQIVMSRAHGRTEPLEQALMTHKAWSDSVSEAKANIKTLRDTRWDDYEFSIELGKAESGGDHSSLRELLSEDDTNAVSTAFNEALSVAFDNLRKQFHGIVSSIPDADDPHAIPISVFLLRILREVAQRVSSDSRTQKLSSSTPKSSLLEDKSSAPVLPLQLLQPLHQRLAVATSSAAISSYSVSLRRDFQVSFPVIGRGIWDSGTPSLPVQISPSVFKLMRGLVTDMTKLGPDLWGKSAIQELKGVVSKGMSEVLSQALESWQRSNDANVPSAKADGEDIESPKDPAEAGAIDNEKGVEDDKPSTGGAQKKDNDDIDDKALTTGDVAERASRQKDKLTQLLLDAFYLQLVLSPSSVASAPSTAIQPKPLESNVKAISAQLQLAEPDLQRLHKSGSENWKRTYLLFALLAL